MSYVSISKICKTISNKLTMDNTFQNINCKCVVKKVSQYPYMIYIDVTDIESPTHILCATIPVNIYKEQIKINDIIIVKGNIIYQKSLNFKISSYYIDKPQISNYENILSNLENNNFLSIPKKNIPQLINNIAILSSTNAAGLKDCLTIIKHLPLENIYIYPITLQGPYMQLSVLDALSQCNKDRIKLKIDLILLIRGGGSKTDLEWFDNYNIATKILQSNIPVICGIGHEIDHTIMDVVCDKSLHTPTHVGTYICDLFNVQKNFNHVLNNIYGQKMKLLNNNIHHVDKCITNHEKLINKDFENIYEKIKYSYEEKNNKMKNIYENLEKIIINYANKYEKNMHMLRDNITSIDMSTHMLHDKIVDIIDKYNIIQVWDNDTSIMITSKADMIKCYQSNHKISIKFIDGSMDIN